MRAARFAMIPALLIALASAACEKKSDDGAAQSTPPDADVFTVPDLGVFYLPYKNDLIQKTLRKGEIWEPQNLEVFEAFIRPGMTVVDVGAYIGSHTIKFGKLAEPGKVYAFEPQDDIYEILNRNVELNGLSENVTAFKMALGDQTCTTKMVRNPKPASDPEKFNNRGATRMQGCIDGSGDPLAFEMRTLDSFELEDVDFIKIDVEGAQLLVLQGAEKTLARHRPVMLIEITERSKDFSHHASMARGEVIQWLEEHGYAVLTWRGSDHLAIPRPHHRSAGAGSPSAQ